MDTSCLKKKTPIAHNILALVALNLLFFTGNSYPRRILDWIYEPASISATTVLLSALHLVYYALYFFVLILCFTESQPLFSGDSFRRAARPWERFHLDKLLILYAVQVVFDVFCGCVSLYMPDFFRDVCILLLWMIQYAILAEKRRSLFFRKRQLIITLVVLVAVLALKIGVSVALAGYCGTLDGGPFPAADYVCTQHEKCKMNAMFMQSVSDMVFDTVIGCVLVISHFRCGSSAENSLEPSEETCEKLDRHTRLRGIMAWWIRCWCIVALVFIMDGARVLICPHNQIWHLTIPAEFGLDGMAVTRVEGRFDEKIVFDMDYD